MTVKIMQIFFFIQNMELHFTLSTAFCLFFFFFQAEDGIRDHCVTGVQTCALPIWAARTQARMSSRIAAPAVAFALIYLSSSPAQALPSFARQTGKPCAQCHVVA